MLPKVVHVYHPSGSAGTSACHWAANHETKGTWIVAANVAQRTCNPLGLGPRTDARRRFTTCEELRSALRVPRRRAAARAARASPAATLYFQSEVPFSMPLACPGVVHAVLLRDPLERTLSLARKHQAANLSRGLVYEGDYLVRMLAQVTHGPVSPRDMAIARRRDVFVLRMQHMADDVRAFEKALNITHQAVPRKNAHGDVSHMHYQDSALKRWLATSLPDRSLYWSLLERVAEPSTARAAEPTI